jgi:tetratricopeptide (TPR) repeat protein
MSEEIADLADQSSSGTDSNGLALDLAMEAARKDPSLHAEVAAFLADQRHMLADQRHHLHEQLKQLHLGIFEKWLSVLLKLATLVVGLAVAGGAGWVVREASRADGLRVEPFSVPPDLAANGLTGQVVAARMIDRLSELQAQTNTGRPARTYSNTWGDKAIKLEIPETGVSLEELDSWLRAKLGHETSLSGEVVRTPSGVTLTARAGGGGAVSVSGPEADMTALTGKLAEAVYRLTQPYRYAIYLMRHETRPADAAPIFGELALHGNAEERRWSYNMWANATEIADHDHDLGLRMYRKAHEADPDAIQPMSTLASDLSRFGRIEESLQIQKEGVAIARKSDPSAREPDLANYSDNLARAVDRLRNGVRGISKSILVGQLASAQTNLHQLSAARANLAEVPPDVDLDPVNKTRAELEIGLDAEDWHGVLAHAGDMAAYLKAYPRDRHFALVSLAPLLALAQAHLGDFPAAERTIALTPEDCDPCLTTRAQIAELHHQRARADFWFARAVAEAPSFPFAFHDWGRALLARGQPDAAIEKFKLANERAPHFADPLEGWGEALMARNQSHLALAKFAEAEKYAPNWGRLHLKWGEALAYAGKPAEARAQLLRAAALDLTPSEKSELVRLGHV